MRTLLFTSKFQKDLVTQMCHEAWKPIQTSLQLALRLSQIRYKGQLTRSNFSHTSIEASMDATTGLTTDHFQNRFWNFPQSSYPRCRAPGCVALSLRIALLIPGCDQLHSLHERRNSTTYTALVLTPVQCSFCASACESNFSAPEQKK